MFCNPAAHLRHTGAYNPDSLTLFALDFNLRPGANDFLHAAPCGQEFQARPLTSWESTIDKADQGLIHTALRDATTSASSTGTPDSQPTQGSSAIHK